MKIKKVVIQNFYSFKEAEFDLEKYDGLTLLSGVNGAGKSTIAEAVYFGLTGKTIRKSNEDSLVNNQAKKDARVTVYLEHEGLDCLIVRQKKPTRLEFFIDGGNHTQDNVANTQEFINETLNINHKVLLASMFFGQENKVAFLDAAAEDKRTIIRNFLNLDEMFEQRDRIKPIKSLHWQGIKERDAVITENQRTIAKLEAKMEEVQLAKGMFAEYDESVLELEGEIILADEQSVRNYKSLQSKYASKLIELSNILDSLRENNCPTCGQERAFDVDQHDRITDEWSKLKKESEALVEPKPPPVSSEEFFKILKFKELCRDATNYQEMMDELREANIEAEKVKSEHQTWYDIMRFWEKAFSEQGVVKYIIKNVLDYFNFRCNYYLGFLTNSKYLVEFDEELTEKIESSNQEVQYISLSGGEKRKINLAVMLGLKDLLLLTDKSHPNLLFFDEVAENIDEDGVTGLYKLFQEIKKERSVFVITHNKDLKTLLESETQLLISKKDGYSTITG